MTTFQTWSGNERMMRLAEQLGFRECHRHTGFAEVKGKVYDTLTFRLTAEEWQGLHKGCQDKSGGDV